MDTSDLLKICPIAAHPAPEETPVIGLAPFSQLCNVTHTHAKRKRQLWRILDLMQISSHHIIKRTLHWP